MPCSRERITRSAVIIYNPRSGRRHGRHVIVSEMTHALERRGLRVEARATAAPGDATRISRDSVAAGVETIWASRDGTHLGLPGVTYVQARQATASGAGVWVQADGELLGELPMTFECVPAALSLVVP